MFSPCERKFNKENGSCNRIVCLLGNRWMHKVVIGIIILFSLSLPCIG